MEKIGSPGKNPGTGWSRPTETRPQDLRSAPLGGGWSLIQSTRAMSYRLTMSGAGCDDASGTRRAPPLPGHEYLAGVEPPVTFGGHVPSTRRRLNKAGPGWQLRPSHREAGVTAVEISVVLVIIGLVAISVYPAVQDYMELARVKGAVEQVASAVRAARQYAIGTSATSYLVTLTAGPPTTVQLSCEAGCPGTVPNDPTETLVNGGALPGGNATVRFGRLGTLVTDSTGAAANAATSVTVQYVSPGNTYYASQVCVSVAGRIVVPGYTSQSGSGPTPPACPA